MTTKTEHKFTFDQFLEVVEDKQHTYGPRVQVKALLDGTVCAEHKAPYYGVVRGNDHYTLCEACLKEQSPTAKRKMH